LALVSRVLGVGCHRPSFGEPLRPAAAIAAPALATRNHDDPPTDPHTVRVPLFRAAPAGGIGCVRVRSGAGGRRSRRPGTGRLPGPGERAVLVPGARAGDD